MYFDCPIKSHRSPVAILLSSKQHGLLAQDTHMLQSTVLLEFEN